MNKSYVGEDLFERIHLLTEIGIALSGERNPDRVLEMILEGAMDLTNADAGTLYLMSKDKRHLNMAIVRNRSLGYTMGGTSKEKVPFDPIPLYHEDGSPNLQMVVACSVLCGEQGHGKVINIPDAYAEKAYDFSGTRKFDERTGYRSKSFLTVPMRNHEHEIIGVLQLINALDPSTGRVISFDDASQRLVQSLASQAAVTLTQQQLIRDLEDLFHSFVKLIATAIDEKSPYTGEHCRRVPVLTLMLADAAERIQEGPLKAFRLTPEERKELEIAAWLHDCGKITTPEYVIDKATKLEAIFDRIHLVDARLLLMLRDAEIRALREKLSHAVFIDEERTKEIDCKLEQTKARIRSDRAFLHQSNLGGEYMDEAAKAKVRKMAQATWRDFDGTPRPLLDEDMVKNLTISKGTLTDEERRVVNHHIVATIRMLESLPFPKRLQQVPEIAGGHHERMDGKGFPRGLKRHELSWQARMLAIADVFEALTAGDRPYKKAMKLSQALNILGRMKLERHIDPDLFDVFVKEKVYLDYAKRFLKPEQIDEIDESQIPGYGVKVSDPV